MTTNSSLLSIMPIPQQPWMTKMDIPAIASVKVGEVTSNKKEEKVHSPYFLNRDIYSVWEHIKERLIEKRINRLRNIPVEKRTAVQQAEIEANDREIERRTKNKPPFVAFA